MEMNSSNKYRLGGGGGGEDTKRKFAVAFCDTNRSGYLEMRRQRMCDFRSRRRDSCEVVENFLRELDCGTNQLYSSLSTDTQSWLHRTILAGDEADTDAAANNIKSVLERVKDPETEKIIEELDLVAIQLERNSKELKRCFNDSITFRTVR